MKHFELTCTCGNTTHTDGFYPCDNNGNEIEPMKDWKGLYICGRCSKIHDTNTEPTQRIFYDEATERNYTLAELEDGYNKTTKANTVFKEEFPTFNDYLVEALSDNGALTEL